MKRNQKNAGLAFFWIWTFIFLGVVATELLEMNSKMLGAHRTLMTYFTGLLFVVFLGIAGHILFYYEPKKFRPAETLFAIIGIAAFVAFFMGLQHHVPVHHLH